MCYFLILMRRLSDRYHLFLKAIFLPSLTMILFSNLASAQPERISIIDFFGLRTVTAEQVRKVIAIREGDTLDDKFDAAEMEKRIREIPGVKHGTFSIVCCDPGTNGKIIFIGISEDEMARSEYNDAPTGKISLPAEIQTAYDSMMHYMIEGIMKGESGEDRTKGYSLMNYPPARFRQEKFLQFARSKWNTLINVLHNAADADQRAIAAAVIAYGDDKRKIVNELLHAVHDPDDEVRNNSTRALALLAGYAHENPGSGIIIPPDPFIKMIRSIVWTDRNKGIAVLAGLTAGRDKKVLEILRRECLAELMEMARWKSAGHAGYPFLILGRMAGVSDESIFLSMDLPDKKSITDEYLKKIIPN